MYTQFLLPTFLSFTVSLALTPIIIHFAKKFGFVDDPKRKHPGILHKKTLPRAGGVPMFLAFLICALLFAEINKYLIAILAGSLINVLVGTLDDKYDFPPQFRLFTQVVSALCIVFVGVTIYMTNPFGEGLIYFDQWQFAVPGLKDSYLTLPSGLILVFWIVWVANMINWSKGASQLPGQAVIAFLTLAAVALKYQAGNPAQIQTALLSFILAGSVLAFLPFNFPPERMLPGFGASTFIGFNLAVLAVLSGGKMAAAILVLGIPAVDMVLTLTRRILSGKSILYGDRKHFYHQLLNLGFSKRQVIFIYWLITAVLGFLALNLGSEGKFFVLAIVAVLVTAAFLTLTLLLKNKKTGRRVISMTEMIFTRYPR
ncbi:MAG: undecaprenyl/decaprenyl-phosphate alpha-N-acetylglucosaminyl 1-phosphate transferase [Candidatus Cloacimonetes bacterium]|nr:undecaprenyl/decaprenyl-phosphate alpha-N-acetylglucosaminyl 1-phosphate transferase [Candidatus Cloacimonadota bacterium]